MLMLFKLYNRIKTNTNEVSEFKIFNEIQIKTNLN